MPRVPSIAFLVLCTLSSAAASTITMGPEQPSSYLSFRPETPDPNPVNATIASGGDSFMAAWAASYSAGTGSIFLEPLDRDGTPHAIKTLPGVVNPRATFISWSGSAYRVVWTEIAKRPLLYAADVDRDANVIVAPHVLNDQGGGSDAWGVASTFDRTLVTSTSFMMFDQSGTLLGWLPMPLNKLGAAALDSAGATIFWIDGSSLLGRRLDRNGQPGSTFTVAQVSNHPMQIAAAANGDTTEVVVAEGQPSTYTIRRFRIDGSSATQELTSFAESPHRPAETLNRLRVTPARGGFLVYWSTSTSVFTNAAGDTVEWHDLSDDYPRKPAIPDVTLASGDAHVVGINRLVYAFVLDATPALTPIRLFAIGSFPAPEFGPAVASLGDQSLVVWSEGRLNADGLWSSIVLGSLLAADGSRIGDLIPIGDGGGAQVIVVGNEYWVFWSLASPWGNAISMRRVRRDGSMTAPQFYWTAVGTQLRLATNGKIVQLVFVEGGAANVLPGNLKAIRFNLNGDLLDPTPFTVFSPFGDGGTASHPVVASNGDGFLVAFTHSYRTCQIGTGCYLSIVTQALAARFDAAGNVIDDPPIAVTAENGVTSSVSVQDVASDGRDYFIVYSQMNALYGKRVVREGVLADGVASQPGVQMEATPYAPSAILQSISNGYIAFVVGGSLTGVETTAIRLDIHGNRIDEPVTIRGAISGSARTANGFIVAYTRPADEPEAAGATRVFTRTLSLEGPRVRAVRHF